MWEDGFGSKPGLHLGQGREEDDRQERMRRWEGIEKGTETGRREGVYIEKKGREESLWDSA